MFLNVKQTQKQRKNILLDTKHLNIDSKAFFPFKRLNGSKYIISN